jgi:hypothetical protein
MHVQTYTSLYPNYPSYVLTLTAYPHFCHFYCCFHQLSLTHADNVRSVMSNFHLEFISSFAFGFCSSAVAIVASSVSVWISRGGRGSRALGPSGSGLEVYYSQHPPLNSSLAPSSSRASICSSRIMTSAKP